MRKSRASANDKKVTKNDLDVYRQELQIDDHIISIEALEIRYGTNVKTGLTFEKAYNELRSQGPNALIPAKTKSRLSIFVGYMFGGFSLLLWIGAMLSLISFCINYTNDSESGSADGNDFDQLYLAGVIIIVVVITGIFGFYQESANNSIMDSFKNMIPRSANVIRDGEQELIPSEDLVVGDIVTLQFGDCVPADIRIVECSSLRVDNSSITGESEPLLRSPDNTDLNPLETANLAFYGTNVVEGTGHGIVIATGDRTLMGKIAGLTSGLQAEETPIKKELKKFMRIITILSMSCGIIFFIIVLNMNYPFDICFVYFIAIVVANVPEGLLVTMTACLTLTAKKMAKKNCLVKNLHAIETLGSTNVICSDKTGTLTQNRMTVSHFYYNGSIVDVLAETFKKPNDLGFEVLARCGMLCNRAEFKPNQEDVPVNSRLVNGDASESGVLKCMEFLTGPVSDTRASYPKVAEIPFNSTNKYQISIHLKGDGSYLLVMKGAPERILDRSTSIFFNNTDYSMNDQSRYNIKSAMLELGFMGERVLGFADLDLESSEYPLGYKFNVDAINFPTTGVRFVGLMSMIDPPRPGVPIAVSKCKTAGIRVIMVTGDHPVTAMSIAKKVGIIDRGNETVYDIAMRRNISASKVSKEDQARCTAAVITGSDLRDMESEDLDALITKFKEIVFARTSPQQKLQIVESFQRTNSIVAVTGDGVNDSPALKKADIGIAMGISGSEVSKEAADMIILDDNFTSIVVGIEEGRLIFDNLKKSIAYMLTSNMPEMIPYILFVLINIPLPISVMAILIIDVGTDLWPGISLAYERAEADIMLRRPRDPVYDKLVNSRMICFTYLNIGIIQACAGLSSYFYVYAQYGFLPRRLIGIREEWERRYINDLKDSFQQEWSHKDRMVLEKMGYAAFFLAIVTTQVADCFICKTRRLSIVQQGMSNMVMNMGLVFEIFVACFVVYCPYVNTLCRFEAVHITCILPALPFALLIVIFDEGRRWLIRRFPGGWTDRETYI